MVCKLFIIKYFNKYKENNIINDRFIVYKNINVKNNKIFSHTKEILHSKRNIHFKIFCINNNNTNKFKIIKNHKIVYKNNDIFNNNQEINNKFNCINQYKNKIKTSIYRGVSKNGNKYQVLLMDKKYKYYLGNFNKEILAAKIYDYFVILFKKKNAFTNFESNNE